MTETAFQKAREVMRSANYVRGLITAAKNQVGKYTKFEMVHRANLQYGKADGAKKALEKAMIKLEELRKKFADMKFPDPDLTEVQARCKTCGAKVPAGHVYCDNDECMC